MPINEDGQVTRGTCQNLVQGLRARSMMPEAVNAALAQAVQFTQQLADSYSAQVAPGEVGEDGSARASEDPIVGDQPPTVLLYGRVQSGKTAAMILSSALAFDNGFRVIVVLTADNVALVQQTANRFKALDGPRVFSSTKEDAYEWEGQEDELRQDIASDGLVIVCAKSAFHLPAFIQFLTEIEAPSYPALIFDDEADAATPDTTLAARSSGRASAPNFASTINRRVIENSRPGEEGESIREIFPHSVFVQVTATPYLLFLQRSDSALRPNNVFLLEPGDGYCGGEAFFSGFDFRAAQPDAPIVLVPDNEGQALNRRRVPVGLAASIEFFLLAAAAKALLDGGWPADGYGYKHLSHPSHRINQHGVVAAHIERHLAEIRRQLREDRAGCAVRFGRAYTELRRTAPNAPELDTLLATVREAIRQTEYIRVNSETDVPRYGPRLNFLIGGNILGRGLTIDELLVTYYVREAQVSQMDTVWQHARMYGYRRPLMAFTRVFLPRGVARRFKDIHESEEELRELLRLEAGGENVPIRLATGTRAARRNATEPASLRVVRGGLQQLFPLYLSEDENAAAQIRQMLETANVPIAPGEDRADRATPVPLDLVFDLVSAVPVRDDDPGRWNPEVISAIIESYRDQYDGQCCVYVRRLQAESQPDQGWIRGRLGGPEITFIRAAAPGVPALALLYLGDMDRPRAWYPTLVLPPGASSYIINPF
jgi:hypothetical protein